MGLGRGRTITPQWKGSNSVTLRSDGEEKTQKKEQSERFRDVELVRYASEKKTAEQLGVVGWVSNAFMGRTESWSEIFD